MIDASELSRKLQIAPGTRIRMWDVPDRYMRALAAAGFAERATRGESYDGALVFCENPQGVAAVLTKVLEGLPALGFVSMIRRNLLARSDGGHGSGWDRGQLWFQC